MTKNGRLMMQQVLCYGFSSLYIRVDAKSRASWSGTPIGYCRTALRRLVAKGLIERVKNGSHRIYGLTEAGVAAQGSWWPKRYEPVTPNEEPVTPNAEPVTPNAEPCKRSQNELR